MSWPDPCDLYYVLAQVLWCSPKSSVVLGAQQKSLRTQGKAMCLLESDQTCTDFSQPSRLMGPFW